MLCDFSEGGCTHYVGVVEEAFLHDFGGAEFVTADEDVYV
jgi:hypothetical protein